MATPRRIKSSARAKAKKPKRRTARLKKIQARLRRPTGKPKKTAKPAVAAKRQQTPTTGSSEAATKPPDAVVRDSDPSEVPIHRETYMASGTGMLLLVLALAIGTVVLLGRIFLPETIHFLVWEFASSLVVVILGCFVFGVAAAFTLSLSPRWRKMREIRRLTKI